MTRGFVEVSRLAQSLGAKKETLAGLSGFGDLVLTCTSLQSRNFEFGFNLGKSGEYDFRSDVQANAYRPSKIKYSDIQTNGSRRYNVTFRYLSEFMSTFAAKGQYPNLGNQSNRMSAIEVSHGPYKIHAYRLTYSKSSLAGLSRLSKVEKVGNDYVYSGGEIVSGTTLPAHSFTVTVAPPPPSIVSADLRF